MQTYKWKVREKTGICAFLTKKEAKEKFPHASDFFKIEFPFFMGIVAFKDDQKLTEIKTGLILCPDGREIPVVLGRDSFTGEQIIGIRGGEPKDSSFSRLMAELIRKEMRLQII